MDRRCEGSARASMEHCDFQRKPCQVGKCQPSPLPNPCVPSAALQSARAMVAGGHLASPLNSSCPQRWGCRKEGAGGKSKTRARAGSGTQPYHVLVFFLINQLIGKAKRNTHTSHPQRERIFHLLIHSLKCPHLLGLGQAEARSMDFHPYFFHVRGKDPRI